MVSLRADAFFDGRYFNLKEFYEGKLAVAETGLMKAAGIGAGVGRDRYRAHVQSSGLDPKLAKTVRGLVYPRPGVKTLSPAAFIYTKAPRILAAFESGGTIRPVKGSKFLWIPTENVPRLGGRKMKPLEVESRFGDFDLVPSLLRPGTFLAVVRARRNAKSGRVRSIIKLKRQPKKADRIVMFTLVKFTSLRKRLDIAGVERGLEAEWPEIVARSLAEAFTNEDRG
ncbi:DUF6441 family protein [Chenggangzhangella methanolivorans]|uniref:DUF6441 family protein n=1 Tax=Chenggangzhangella methanolivorans TaxID=1437009 RepID=A0A9E6UN39_9HYPH|nr:DUF6441 family protein [Chenggangzhangella methanolivorans]QZN99793.1 DUF6441 family protein [Chenggangzhangella methanolivorans]